MTVHNLSAPFSAQEAPLRIAVVGRGFSGMMTAIALLKTVSRPFHIWMFDPHPALSGGQTLSSVLSSEILNSRVRDLSVSTGAPDDFTDWLTENMRFRQAVHAAIPGFGQIFVQKAVFSDYLYQRFSDALADRRDVSMQMSGDMVMSLRRNPEGGFLLGVDAQGDICCDVVFLATGYGAAAYAGNSLQSNDPPVGHRLDGPRHIVVLGNGLRAVDRVLQLRDGGYTGLITILSRRGFLPQAHTRLSADPVFPADVMPKRLRAMVRFVRRACEQAEADGKGWQAAMNGLRKRARSFWSALSQTEKRQFNRHLRAIYDSHRNRIPPDMHGRLEKEFAGGLTELKRGRAIRRTQDGLFVRWRGRDSEDLIQADEVIDCRCLSPDLSDPLISGMLQSGLAKTDELGLGLAVNGSGEVVGPRARPGGIFAIGPIGLGSLPDIDLVPEIVTQAYAAAALVASFHRQRLKAG